MSTVIRTRLIKIGNLQGICIPKVVLDPLHLADTIESEIQNRQLILRSSAVPHTG